jgi:hypothetical protein
MLANRGYVERGWLHRRHDFARRARIASCLEAVANGHREFREACRAVDALHRGEKRLAQDLDALVEISGRTLRLLKASLERFSVKQSAGYDLGPTLAVAHQTARPLPDALHDLYTLHAEIESSLTILIRASWMLGDRELKNACIELEALSRQQRDWVQAHLIH